jgi:hypothetical protein
MCRAWMRYRKALSNLGIETLDCPVVCSRSKTAIDINRTSYCEKCPQTLRQKEFQRETERLWEQWMPNQASSINFDAMRFQLNAVLTARSPPETELPALVFHYATVYDAEKARYEQLERSLNP